MREKERERREGERGVLTSSPPRSILFLSHERQQTRSLFFRPLMQTRTLWLSITSIWENFRRDINGNTTCGRNSTYNKWEELGTILFFRNWDTINFSKQSPPFPCPLLSSSSSPLSVPTRRFTPHNAPQSISPLNFRLYFLISGLCVWGNRSTGPARHKYHRQSPNLYIHEQDTIVTHIEGSSNHITEVVSKYTAIPSQHDHSCYV